MNNIPRESLNGRTFFTNKEDLMRINIQETSTRYIKYMERVSKFLI